VLLMSNKPIGIEEFSELASAVQAEIGKIIVGQELVIRHVFMSILVGGHVLLEGVPGLGKTLLIRCLGQVLDLNFSRIQFTPDLMPADIVGTEILIDQDGQRAFHFQPGPIFSNLVLADEINRATPKTQSALLEAMQEGSVTVANKTYQLEMPFFVMATQNPIEMEGTYPLPEAQLDRFLFKVDVPYPPASDLVTIFNRTTEDQLPTIGTVASGQDILRMRSLVRQVPSATHIQEYVARLVTATHPDNPDAPPLVRQYVRYGSSPRGGQAMILAGKALALLSGRYNLSIEDVKVVAPASLQHRLLLNFEGLAEGIDPDRIIHELIDQVRE
jgi:MoxR-like ATPase